MAASLFPTPHSFASEHSNFLCVSNTPLVEYTLPCRSPWDDWQSPLQDEFVISAWWPPTMNVIHQYAAAHFNHVLGGNVAAGCQENGTMRMGASYDEAFACVADQLPIYKELGLKVTLGVGFFNNSMKLEDLTYGGAANMGGVIDANMNDGPITRRVGAFTVPEMRWAMEYLKNRSLDSLVHAVFLHDDVVTANAMTLAVVDWLKEHYPKILPVTNVGGQGPDTAYEQRQATATAARTRRHPSVTAHAMPEPTSRQAVACSAAPPSLS